MSRATSASGTSTSSLPASRTVVRRFSPAVRLDDEVHEYLEIALGRERLHEVLQAMCRPPLNCCLRVNTQRANAEEVVSCLAEQLSAADRKVLGSHKPFIHDRLPNVVCVPGSGPNALDFNEPGLKEVVVTRKAGEAILRGAHAYAPGVLAVSQGLAAGDRVAVSMALEVPGTESFGMTRGWVLRPDALPSEGPGVDRSNYYIGIGSAQMSRREIFRVTSGVAVELEQRVFDIPACYGVLGGKVTLQNLPSTVAALALAPLPGSRVLDMCAAPGGKTCTLAEVMQDRGTVVALDRTTDKVGNVVRMAEALGHTCIQALKKDSTCILKLSPEVRAQRKQLEEEEGGSMRRRTRGPAKPMSENEILRRKRRAARALQHGDPLPKGCALPAAVAEAGEATLPEPLDPYPDGFERESFDYVLLDGPCSAMGIRPRLTVVTRLRELQRAAHYQRMMIREAVHLLRVGGGLVYSTCTMDPHENEANVRWLLDRWPQMRLVEQTPRLGGAGLTGSASVPDGRGGYVTETWLTADEAQLVQRFDVAQGPDTIAFFIAKFEKVAAIPEEDVLTPVKLLL